MVLKFRHHNEIDKHTWDLLVEQSMNGNIYCTSTYLDHLSPGWAAITNEDYSVGMALPLRKKWGISYIYPPFFTQQLGIIYINEEHNLPAEDFLELIPANIQLIELNLNASNHYGDLKNAAITGRKNYVLPLCKSFKHLNAAFSRSAKRNLQKAIISEVIVQEGVGIPAVMKIHRQRFDETIQIPAKEYDQFEKLLQKLQQQKMVYTIGAYLKDELIAGSIFLKFKGRLTFIISGNAQASLGNGATHLLMHSVIEKFSGQNLILDFEGSDVPAFARFYEQYGAVPEHFTFIRINRLNFIIKWLKNRRGF